MADEPAAPDTGSDEQPTEPAKTDDQPAPADTDDKDWKAEAEKWQTQARKHEKRAKDNSTAAKELEKLKASMMSEQEKAVAEAEARGRQAAVGEVGQRLAAAEIKAALTGVVPDPAALVDDLNLAKYVGEDGQVDADAVAELRKKFEALKPKDETPPGQGEPPKVRLPNSDRLQLDDETDPRKLAATIRRL